jgi:hypothetical protein
VWLRGGTSWRMGQKSGARPFFARIANRSNSYDTPTNSDGERFLRDFCTKGNLLMDATFMSMV